MNGVPIMARLPALGRQGRHMLLRLAILAGLIVGVPYLVLFAVAAGSPVDISDTVQSVVETAQQRNALRGQLGLDLPLVWRLPQWLMHAGLWRFGPSRLYGTGALGVVADAARVTLALVIGATLLATLVGLQAGWLAALRPGGRLDRVVRAAVRLLPGVPDYLIVLVGALVWLKLAAWIGLAGAPEFVQRLVGFGLALTALAMLPAAAIADRLRAALAGMLAAPYVGAARLRGLSEATILRHYALPSVLPTLVDTLRTLLAPLLGASILIEYAIGLPGLGWLLVNAVILKDYALLQALVACYGVGIAIMAVCIELLDARVRQNLESQP